MAAEDVSGEADEPRRWRLHRGVLLLLGLASPLGGEHTGGGRTRLLVVAPRLSGPVPGAAA